MATITGADILQRMYEKQALDQAGPVDQAQFGWLDWGQLGRDLPFYRGSVQEGDQRIDPEALAQYLTQNQYSIGQEFGPGNADIRWLQDASGNKLIQPRNYATNDRTAALIGMALLGGMGYTAATAGVGATGAGGVGAGYGTGSAAFGDAAAAGAAGGPAGGAAGGSVLGTGESYGGLMDAALSDAVAQSATEAGLMGGGTGYSSLTGSLIPSGGSLLGPGETYGGLMDDALKEAVSESAVQAGLQGGETTYSPLTDTITPAVTPGATVNPPSTPGTTTTPGTTPGADNPLGTAYDWLKANPDLAKLLFGGAGALLSQLGGKEDAPYTGPMPTITQGGWQSSVSPTLMQAPARGLMGVKQGEANSGLWRLLGGS